MKVQDFEGAAEVTSEDELKRFLSRRFGEGVNEFWLSHEKNNPALSIMVNGQLATMHYFTKERHPGFRSIGKVEGLERGGMSTFFTQTPHQKQPVLNDAVVPFSVALRAACEFLHSKQLPGSLEWLEL